ncbi:MAG: hypothetical protein R2697_04810 [Ilumatobacteraceae bacterium]
MTGLRHLTVPLDDRSYEVVVGPGAAAYLGTVLPKSARRAAIVSQASIPLEVATDLPYERFDIGVGEQFKSLDTIGEFVPWLCPDGAHPQRRRDRRRRRGWSPTSPIGLLRHHRGVPVVHVSTTLLGMVDAAIGALTREPARGQEPRRRRSGSPAV